METPLSDEEVIRRYGEAPELPFKEQVATALRSLGSSHYHAGRLEKAQACFEDLIRRYEGAAELPLRQAPFLFDEPAVQVRSLVPAPVCSIVKVCFDPSLSAFETAVTL